MTSHKKQLMNNRLILAICFFAVVLSWAVLVAIVPNINAKNNLESVLQVLATIITTSFGFYFLVKATSLFMKKRIKNAFLWLILALVFVLPAVFICLLVNVWWSPCADGGFFGTPGVVDEICLSNWRIYWIIYFIITFICGYLLCIGIEQIKKLRELNK